MRKDQGQLCSAGDPVQTGGKTFAEFHVSQTVQTVQTVSQNVKTGA